MQWKKLGRIFDPTIYKLPNNCFEFAQSPQTLVFDNFIRIYFSTREKDKTGKYLSHIAFVDMDKDFEKVITSKTKAIIICNPNNPTGYAYSRDEMEQLKELVLKHLKWFWMQ